jgi:hypothetical protein
MKANNSNKSYDTIGGTEWITVRELIALIIPKLREAHKRGWAHWGGANERPRNFNARLSKDDVHQQLDDMVKHGAFVDCQDPSKNALEAMLPGTDRHISQECKVRKTDVDRVIVCLIPMIEIQGQRDAAAEWKKTEQRLTPIDVTGQLKLIPESKEAYDFATKLAKAAWAGEIPAFAPGRRVRRVYTPEEIQRSPLNFVDEFYRTDLDDWFKNNEPRNTIRFDPPMTEMMSKMVTAFKRVLQRGRRPSARNVGSEVGKNHSFVSKHWAEIQRRANDPVVIAERKK